MKSIRIVCMLASIILISLTSCSEITCENTMCENNGVCIDGVCDCPEGFTGTYCNEQATPDKIRFLTIVVTRFPGLKKGVQWDGADGPDIFFRLFDGEQRLAQPLVLYENADATLDYSFFINPIDMRNVAGVHTMQLLDYDGIDIDDDFMGEVSFTPYHSTNGFPETIILDDGGPVAFILTVEYLYNDPDPS